MQWIKGLILSFVLSASLYADIAPVYEFRGINTDDSSLTLAGGQTPDSQNVLTDDGPGIQGRKGFIQFSTETTSSDIWEFPLSNGTRYIIIRSSNTLKAATSSGQFTTLISTIPTDRQTYGSVLGDKFYFINTTDGLKYWNGATVTVASSTLKGTMIVTHKGRLWVSGIGGAERTLYISKYLDGTSWATPVNPTADDATQLTIAGALDENVQAIFSSFQDKVVWLKKNSFGGIFGSNRLNFSQRTFSDTVGVASPDSIKDCDGLLRWLGPDRKVWEFDGATYYKISEQVDVMFSSILQGETATRSAVLTTKSDFDSGTVETGHLSTSISEGSVVLSTIAARTFNDSSASDFNSGTIVNLDTFTAPGSLTLSLGAENIQQSQYGTDDTEFTVSGSTAYYSKFVTTQGYILTSVLFRLRTTATGADTNVTINLRSDSSGSPGTLLQSDGVTTSGLLSTYTDQTLDVTDRQLEPATTYWINIQRTFPIGIGSSVFWSYDTSFTGGAVYDTVVTNNQTFNFKTRGKQYSPTGSIVSQSFDVGFTTASYLWNWGIYQGTVNLDGENLIHETQTSADGSSWNSLITVVNGSTITSTVRRYIRYKISFETTSRSHSPTVDAVTINYGPFLASSGTYISKAIQTGSGISVWQPITIGNTVSGSGSIVYQVQSASYSTSSSYPASGWVTITNNSIPTVSTNTYIAFRSTFTPVSATDALSINDFTFSWTEGSTLRSASGYINQRYWLAVSTVSSSNQVVFVYDKKREWQKYVGINAACMGKYLSGLYFGNTSGIFQTEQGYSDAGTSITSYYKTKDFFPSNFDTPSKFNYIYMTTENSDGTLSTTYKINGTTVSYTLGSVQMNTQAGIQNFKIPFLTSEITQGKFLNILWQVVGTTFWRIINGNIYYDKGLLPD